MNTIEFIQKIRNGEIDPAENIARVMEEISKLNKEYNHFNMIADDAEKQAKNINLKGRLAGLPVSVKDCICVKGMESRSGSKILSGYKPVFDATAVRKVREEGGIIIGKTSQDEFGFGSFSSNMGEGFETPLNPVDKKRACGGSSGGSGGITAKISFPHISLGESTGGSIASPASFCGVTGLCPTYGRVSRYGLIDYGNSLDKIGPMAKSVSGAALMLEIIAGHDKNESTSLDKPVDAYTDYLQKDIKGMRIGVIREAFGEGIDDEVSEKVKDAISRLEDMGAKTEEVSLPLTMKYGIPAYYLISTSEASTNLAKFCGMRYGKTEELEDGFNKYFSKVRSSNLGEEAKRRIMLGTFARMAGYRDAYYIKALKVRSMIIKEYKKVFKKFDLLASPTMPSIAPKFSDIEKLSPLQQYMMDVLTVGPNIAGLPHLSVNAGELKGMPVGMMMVGDHLEEKKLVQAGGKLE
ncbi:Asp-tRNA(Asn)/Glu-tRNA(Gln) amidotransferase subunit GatA [Candidatus Woesearchaeota archaeon]|nr:Asp-tRNA(Asn)/Glu-tRNA(Gln) amidotransferase subunit GatA [Candidatus Woesearchaeota archaeon]